MNTHSCSCPDHRALQSRSEEADQQSSRQRARDVMANLEMRLVSAGALVSFQRMPVAVWTATADAISQPDPLPRLESRCRSMTIPFGDLEPSDDLLNKSVASTRLKTWLQRRLRQLALAQRIQDARALRSEFLVD